MGPQYQSGRHDGAPEPKDHRLPHSRIGTVREIFLTMEIADEGKSPDKFTFQCDAYCDQDLRHHLLLMTQDSDITRPELDDIAYLHEPNHTERPEETMKAAYERLEDWYRKLLVDSVMWGTQQAVENVLDNVPATVENLGLHRPEHRNATPVAITATANTTTSIRIEWQEPNSSVPITGYSLRHQIPDETWTQVQLEPNVLVHDVSGLKVNTRYRFELLAKNAIGESPWSSPAITSTPDPVVGITATADSVQEGKAARFNIALSRRTSAEVMLAVKFTGNFGTDAVRSIQVLNAQTQEIQVPTQLASGNTEGSVSVEIIAKDNYRISSTKESAHVAITHRLQSR